MDLKNMMRKIKKSFRFVYYKDIFYETDTAY